MDWEHRCRPRLYFLSIANSLFELRLTLELRLELILILEFELILVLIL